MSEAINGFYLFLCKLNKPALLVAHNSKFDVPLLLNAIQKCSMVDIFKGVIYGFCDSLGILKKVFPDRKSAGKFKLSTLTNDLLQVNGNFHEALCDVMCLETICCHFLIVDHFKKYYKTFDKSLKNLNISRRTNLRLCLFSQFESILSNRYNNRITKLASTDLTYDTLKQMYEKDGQQKLIDLSEKVDNKPRLTNRRNAYLQRLLTISKNECDIKVFYFITLFKTRFNLFY